MYRKVCFLLGFLVTLVCFQIRVQATVTQTTDGQGITWQLVSAGDDLRTLLTSSAINPLYIKASQDLTFGGGNVTLPAGLTVTLDMGNHALYSTQNGTFGLNNNCKVTFQNEYKVSTGTMNQTTVPNTNGIGSMSGYYNNFWGTWYTTGGLNGTSLTYKNVTEDLSSITSWGNGGQPFYNYGIPVNFSGTNVFNYQNSGQEFMEGNGIIVLDGTTSITHYTTGTGVIWANASPVISVAAGASLTIDASTLPQQNRGFWYLDNSPAMTITNNGSLNWKMAQANTGFYVNGLSALTMKFGPQSNTTISAPGFFDFSKPSGAFTTTIGNGATFIYNAGAYPVFNGTPTGSDKFTINSANLVRLNSSLTPTTSILGADSTQMPISLQLDSLDNTGMGYNINGYDSSGNAKLTSSMTAGLYGMIGSFHAALNDLSALTNGLHVASSLDVKTYQTAAQLEFVKQNASLSFLQLPDATSMSWNYPISSSFSNLLLSRNGTSPNMAFSMMATARKPSFSLQVSVQNSNLPTGINFAWLQSSSDSLVPLNSAATTLFTNASAGVTNPSYGQFNLTQSAQMGLLLQAQSNKIYQGTYSATINWTLVDGVQ